jgi:hypothetical protein
MRFSNLFFFPFIATLVEALPPAPESLSSKPLKIRKGINHGNQAKFFALLSSPLDTIVNVRTPDKKRALPKLSDLAEPTRRSLEETRRKIFELLNDYSEITGRGITPLLMNSTEYRSLSKSRANEAENQ